MQLSIELFESPRARRNDPTTSHEAAAAARELAAGHYRLISNILKTAGPLGKDGIGARTSLTGVQVCRRLTEMKRLGLIVPTGKTVKSTAGRNEREWRAA
jgi:hypothetical protein